jgi:hypothetical protein
MASRIRVEKALEFTNVKMNVILNAQVSDTQVTLRRTEAEKKFFFMNCKK